MNELVLSKTDVKKLTWFAVLTVILSFVGGYLIAPTPDLNIESRLARIESKILEFDIQDFKRNQESQSLNNSINAKQTTSKLPQTEIYNAVQLVKNNLVESSVDIYAIQAGVFTFYSNAKTLHIRLLARGIKNQIIEQEKHLAGTYRIVIEQFDNQTDALTALRELRDLYNMPLSLVKLETLAKSDAVAMN